MKNEIEKIDTLYNKVAELIEQARQKVATTVNLTMVYTYYEIGRYIVENEQQDEQLYNHIRNRFGRNNKNLRTLAQ
jgi:hypothetical protein